MQVVDIFKSYIEWLMLNNIEVIFDGIEVYDVEFYIILDVFVERLIVVYGKYYGDFEGIIIIQGGFVDGIVISVFFFVDYIEGIQENIVLKYFWVRK